jgi:hypothetical protein
LARFLAHTVVRVNDRAHKDGRDRRILQRREFVSKHENGGDDGQEFANRGDDGELQSVKLGNCRADTTARQGAIVRTKCAMKTHETNAQRNALVKKTKICPMAE